MKIKVNHQEAADLLKSHFQQRDYSVNVDSVEISAATTSADNRPTIVLCNLVSAARNARTEFHAGSHKIAAIKAVRAEAAAQGFFVGLADSKLFVESIVHGI